MKKLVLRLLMFYWLLHTIGKAFGAEGFIAERVPGHFEPEATMAVDKAIEYHTAKNYKKAFELYSKAIELDSKLYPAYCNRANVRNELGDRKGALEDYNQGLALYPNNYICLTARGQHYKAGKEYKLAISDLTKALDLSPDNVMILVNRADSYFYAGEYDKALADADLAIKLKPDAKYLAVFRASVRLRTQDWTGIINDCNLAKQNGAYSQQCLLMVALSYSKLCKLNDAQLLLNELSEQAEQKKLSAKLLKSITWLNNNAKLNCKGKE